MAARTVTVKTLGPDDIATVVAAMKAYIDASVADDQKIYTCDVIGCARDSEVMAVIIWGTKDA